MSNKTSIFANNSLKNAVAGITTFNIGGQLAMHCLKPIITSDDVVTRTIALTMLFISIMLGVRSEIIQNK